MMKGSLKLNLLPDTDYSAQNIKMELLGTESVEYVIDLIYFLKSNVF
jgi:hypothetical protein